MINKNKELGIILTIIGSLITLAIFPTLLGQIGLILFIDPIDLGLESRVTWNAGLFLLSIISFILGTKVFSRLNEITAISIGIVFMLINMGNVVLEFISHTDILNSSPYVLGKILGQIILFILALILLLTGIGLLKKKNSNNSIVLD